MSEAPLKLAEALDILVDKILETYNMPAAKHPELRKVMLQVAASTASLMSKHFQRMLPTPIPEMTPEEITPGLPWKKPGGSNVH